MKIRDLFEGIEDEDEDDRDESDHSRQLRKTGYWGAQAAGCVFMAQDTGRFLLAHRSRNVEQPNTWGSWGGAIDRGLNPEQAVRRETRQETGGQADIIELLPLFIFKDKSFRYYNFLAIVPHEFTPALNWESRGYKWCEFGDWPSPLHFGLVALFDDPVSVVIMKKAAGI